MRLMPYGDGDFGLTIRLETDPEVMAELGGPRPAESLREAHRSRATHNGPGDQWLKIVPEPGGPDAGAIGVWLSDWHGEPIHEVGWMVLPEFQGRGLATILVAARGIWGPGLVRKARNVIAAGQRRLTRNTQNQ